MTTGGQHSPRKVLTDAQELLSNGYFGAAVVFAQAAIEALTEAVVRHWASEENVEYVMDLVYDALRSNFNPRNERVHSMIEVMVQIRLKDQSFWSELVEHVKRRNRVAHGGATATRDEAEASLRVAGAYFDLIEPELKGDIRDRYDLWEAHGDS